MKITNVFRLLIKLFNLFFLAYAIFSILPSIMFMFSSPLNWIVLALVVFQILMVLLVFWILLFKTDWLIKVLKLDKGFDEEIIEFKDSKKEPLMEFAIVVIGGCVLIKYIPLLIGNLYYSFQTAAGLNDVSASYRTDMKIQIASNLLGALVGYLLITNRHKLIRWLKLDKDIE